MKFGVLFFGLLQDGGCRGLLVYCDYVALMTVLARKVFQTEPLQSLGPVVKRTDFFASRCHPGVHLYYPSQTQDMQATH